MVVGAGVLVGAGVDGGHGGWAGHVEGKGGAMVASSRCPVKGPEVCRVGGAGVAGEALVCGECGSGVSCQDVVAAFRTRRHVAIAREAWRRAREGLEEGVVQYIMRYTISYYGTAYDVYGIFRKSAVYLCK